MWNGIAASVLGGVVAVGLHHVLTKPKPFHIDVEQPSMKVAGINIIPLFTKVTSFLPESTRKNYLSKNAAPRKQVRDRYDFTGDTPYTITELKPGKIWKVAYDMELTLFTSKKENDKYQAFTGVDIMSDEYENKLLAGAQTQGDQYKTVAKQDLETVRFWVNKVRTCTEKDEFKDLPYMVLNMIVVKLNSGSLLLYAPVTIRDEVGFGAWLDELGPVEWLIVASGHHTIHIKSIVNRYPMAKVVGPPAAEAKVKEVVNLPRGKFDFNSKNKEDIREVNSKLQDEGCELFDVDGDMLSALLVRCGNTLLECDLVYGHADGEGFAFMDKEKFRKCAPEDWFGRVWKFTNINKPNSVHGFLPNYRYWFMDPNSMGAMMHEPPAPDGSNCTRMANSLREALKMNFDTAVGAHNNEMSGEDFRKTIDKCWNWLDGRSLIED